MSLEGVTSMGAVLLAILLSGLGCSGGEDGGPSTNNGGVGGGAAGSSAAGNSLGGSNQTAGGGAGTAGSGPSGGAATTGGTSQAPEVFNPSLPKPSRDCRTDTAAQCVSIAGTLLGAPLDAHCTNMYPEQTLFPTPAPGGWPAGCRENPTGFTGLSYHVEIPVQAPGAFHHQLSDPFDFAAADVWVTMDEVGGNGQAEHLKTLELAGTVADEPTSGGVLITGTYRGRWATPAAGCGSDCGAADVHGSFRFITVAKPK